MQETKKGVAESLFFVYSYSDDLSVDPEDGSLLFPGWL